MEQLNQTANRVRVIRPVLTEEERQRRMESIRRAAAELILAARAAGHT